MYPAVGAGMGGITIGAGCHSKEASGGCAWTTGVDFAGLAHLGGIGWFHSAEGAGEDPRLMMHDFVARDEATVASDKDLPDTI